MSHPRPCPFCASPLSATLPPTPGEAGRLAFDPWKGRLWEVCSTCLRWSPVALALRWETLEACESAVRDEGRLLLSTEHLSLVEVGEGQLIRVGEPPRVELAGWRYGDRLRNVARSGFWSRVLSALPTPPPEGYRPYALGRVDPPVHWVVSPFHGAAWALTAAFTNVPLAPDCPSCHRPVALRPWEFHTLTVLDTDAGVRILTPCALCDQDVLIPTRAARPALRMGLGIVSPRHATTARAESAARNVESAGGGRGFLSRLARERVQLGDLDGDERLGLTITLDEDAEVEALESEWRTAEEIAAIMDSELSSVPGFDDFRRSVLDRERAQGF